MTFLGSFLTSMLMGLIFLLLARWYVRSLDLSKEPKYTWVWQHRNF